MYFGAASRDHIEDTEMDLYIEMNASWSLLDIFSRTYRSLYLRSLWQ